MTPIPEDQAHSMSFPLPVPIKLFKEEGFSDAHPQTRAQFRAWIKRCRQDLQDLDQALKSNDVDWMCEMAGDLSGAAAELQNISETTRAQMPGR